MTTHFSGQQNQPCSEPKLSWQSSLSSLLHQNWDVNVAHKRSSQNVGSVASVLRENLDLSLQEASCPRNSLSTYITQAAEELTPSLSSTAVQRIISLFLYWAGPSPGCGGITHDLKKPNLNPESEDIPPHKPPFVFSSHSQVHPASQHWRQWMSPTSPYAQLPIAIGLTSLFGYYQGSFLACWRWDPRVDVHSLAKVTGQVSNSDFSIELWPVGGEGEWHLGIVGVGWAWAWWHSSTFSRWSKNMWCFGGPQGSGWLRARVLKSDGLDQPQLSHFLAAWLWLFNVSHGFHMCNCYFSDLFWRWNDTMHVNQ